MADLLQGRGEAPKPAADLPGGRRRGGQTAAPQGDSQTDVRHAAKEQNAGHGALPCRGGFAEGITPPRMHRPGRAAV
jgi:hypothetical protein